jgi:hypothetical protein
MTLKLLVKLCNKILGEEETQKLIDECLEEIKEEVK